MTQDEKVVSMRFIGAMYGKECDSLNILRCEKAKRKVIGKRLPPTEDSFTMHLLRAVYQLMLWKQATEQYMSLPDPTKYGWERVEGKLQPKLMSQSVSAPELLNDLVCDCQDCASSCSCMVNMQPCTAECKCQAVLPSDEMDDIDKCCGNTFTIACTKKDSDSDDESM